MIGHPSRQRVGSSSWGLHGDLQRRTIRIFDSGFGTQSRYGVSVMPVRLRMLVLARVSRRPPGTRAFSCRSASAGMKLSGMSALRASVNQEAGLSASHVAYMLSTPCLTRSRIARHCLKRAMKFSVVGVCTSFRAALATVPTY